MHFFYFDINLKFLIASITIENPNIRVTEIEDLYPLEKNIQEVIIDINAINPKILEPFLSIIILLLSNNPQAINIIKQIDIKIIELEL